MDEPSTLAPRASGALKFLYVYTIVGAGLFGAAAVVAPMQVGRAFGLPSPDPYIFGILGALYTAFAIVAVLGMRRPIAFAPVFVLQLAYKTLWLGVVFLPRAIAGKAPPYAWFLAAVFVSYVVVDLVAIPFARLFSRRVNAFA